MEIVGQGAFPPGFAYCDIVCAPRWRVYLNINRSEHVLELGRPAFYNGVGFFAKSAQQKKMKAIIGLVFDPGVVWELIGAVTFIIGASGVFYTRLSEKQLPGLEKEN
jgi:hypothetical protein